MHLKLEITYITSTCCKSINNIFKVKVQNEAREFILFKKVIGHDLVKHQDMSTNRGGVMFHTDYGSSLNATLSYLVIDLRFDVLDHLPYI